jgi:hypothetical protein
MRCPAPLLCALLAATLLAAAPGLHGQTVEGRVVDHDSGEPLAMVTVELLSGERVAQRARTAEDGSFQLRASDAPPYRLRATRVGYQAATSDVLDVAGRALVEVEFRMSASAVVIDPVTVVARPAPHENSALRNSGFYERQRAGLGRFLVRENIERNTHVTQAISRVAGVNVAGRTPSTERVYFGRAQNLSVSMTTGQGVEICYPIVYLDGIRIGAVESLNAVIAARQVEAIELYRSPAETPVQFTGPEAACGVIVIWSRAAGS